MSVPNTKLVKKHPPFGTWVTIYGIKVVENIRLYFCFQFNSIQFSFVARLNNKLGHNTCTYQDGAASKINIAPEE